MKKIQKEILNIGEVVHKICAEEGINIFPWCGTLLGAARHQGFIPGDDDMDFAVLDGDFERIISALDKKLPKRYFVSTAKSARTKALHIQVFDRNIKENIKRTSRTEYYHPAIDIMSLISVNSPNGNTFKNRLGGEINGAKNVYLKSSSGGAGFFRPFLFLFPQSFLFSKVRKRALKIKDINGKYIYEFSGAYYKTFDKKGFSDFISIKFEGKNITVPIGYKKILETHYGDGRRIPPKSEGRIHISE